jgi:hypothetical protein
MRGMISPRASQNWRRKGQRYNKGKEMKRKGKKDLEELPIKLRSIIAARSRPVSDHTVPKDLYINI